MVATLLATSLLVFGGLYLSPGGPLAYLTGGRTASPEQVAALVEQYGLDDPFLTRYAEFIGRLAHGDLGESVLFRAPVVEILPARLMITAQLVGMALLIILIVGLALGTAAALRGGRLDRLVMTVSSVGLATPVFVAAIVLVALLAVRFPVFPVFGAGSGFVDRIYHLILPAIALAIPGQALVARVTRAAVREEAGREHVEMARSRGLPGHTVIRRHILRNAMMPVTTVAGVTVAGLLASSVLVEQAFGLGGIGSLLVTSIQAKDYAVVQIIALLMVGTFVVVNTVIDLLYLVLDPRVRSR